MGKVSRVLTLKSSDVRRPPERGIYWAHAFTKVSEETMGLRFTAARAVSGVSTWGLKNVFHRPAAYVPGKMAL